MKLESKAIVLNAEASGKLEAIEIAGRALVDAGYIDPGYIKSIKGRESVANTFLGNGIAIPHGLPQNRDLIRKTGVAVVQFPKGVLWNPGETVFIAVAIAAKSDEHIEILTNLTHLLDDLDKIDKIITTKDPQVIIDVLANTKPAAEKAPALDLTGFKSIEAYITGKHGLHARPATFLVDCANDYNSDIYLEFEGKTGNAKSLASLLKLGVTTGKKIRVHAKGDDASAALDVIKTAIESGLGEEEETETTSHLEHCWMPENVKKTIPGIKASPGLAFGPVVQYVHEKIVVEMTAKDPAVELSKLEKAIAAAKINLSNLYDEIRAKAGAGKAAIFKAHIAFLDDPELKTETKSLIDTAKSAGYAWKQVIESKVKALEAHDDAVLAGRAMDLQDVGRRVLKLLANTVHDEPFKPEKPVILVAEDLTPSDTATLDPAYILGLCTAGSGPTSHSAIIARSLGIPAIVATGPAALDVADGTVAILDGDAGNLYLEPSEGDISSAQSAITALDELRNQEYATRFEPAITKDGYRMEVVANIGKVEEAAQAVESGGEGVGLMRTEFLFLGRDSAPDEEEQYQSYKAMLESLNGLPIIIRTLDIGGDKEVSYLDLPAEDNPFLGERGIRLCLKQPELFLTQLRAIYRASKHGELRIMFPMIATMEELAAAKVLAERARIEVGAEPVDIGIMVEVPSVAVMADVFAPEVDFFSVGTNDLAQYLLAMDRLHPTLAAQADSLRPSILRMIDNVVRAAEAEGKWVGVCGGLAGEPLGAVILAGLGVKELSMVLPSIAAIKSHLRTINISDARELAQKALKCRNIKEVRALGIAL